MLSVQMEQRVNNKFIVKLRKIFTEVYAMLKEVYGNEDGRETTEDDSRPGRPSTSKTDENIKTKMTSPAINNGNNGQKETSKTASNATLAQGPSRSEPEVTSSSPLTAWWRVFKLVNLLMQQKC
ncbi:hypothetical protein NQ318_002962 [Aromia moschata]|uniref:Uncharacterized protein n=1 Tax=Aromia moschata TaxID=1265417 RepID=A0AAV8YRV1_9CUCU|nr:hypothetical protein NQ318_002962 [Aromia moschata]